MIEDIKNDIRWIADVATGIFTHSAWRHLAYPLLGAGVIVLLALFAIGLGKLIILGGFKTDLIVIGVVVVLVVTYGIGYAIMHPDDI
jgi:hypothetical protein